MDRLVRRHRSPADRALCLTLALLGLAVALLAHQALASGWSVKPRTESWVTNGTVNVMTQFGSTVYLGGDFTLLGPYTGAGVPIDTTTAQPVAVYPRVDGFVYASVADGAGGWFIGGDFTSVAGTTRDRLAHIMPDGTLDPAWNPGADGDVRTLLLAGSILYVGGDFGTIGGQTRSYAAALDAATGQTLAWAPQPDGAVYAFALSGSTLYVGGDFGTIGGKYHNHLAVFDTASPTSASIPLPFPAWTDNTVYALCVSGSTVYAGGTFLNANSDTRDGVLVSRHYLAAFDVGTGKPTAWNPQANSTVYAMTASGSTIYVGGAFTTFSITQLRNYLAAFTTAGTLTSWDPNADNEVRTFLLDGTTLYAGGSFSKIHGQDRHCLAAIDTTSAQPTSWAPQPNDTVLTLAHDGSTLYAGGTFSSVGGVARAHLAAVDSVTGQPTTFAPNADGVVHALAVNATTLYAGGSFHSVGGAPRPYIAAVATANGLVTPWNPQANDEVDSLALQGEIVYAGGSFLNIGGQTRYRAAALSTTSSLATAWDSHPNGAVHALAVVGTRIYVGGDFTDITSTSLTGIAALDTRTAQPDPAFNANSNGAVNVIVPAGPTIYVAGGFLIIGGQRFHYFAELNASDGTATTWNPYATGVISVVAMADTDLLVGGDFSGIGNGSFDYLADVSRATGVARNWNPAVNGLVNAISNVGPTTFWVGGGFTSVGGAPRRGLAQFDATYSVRFVTDGTAGTNITGDTNQTVVLGGEATSVTAVAPPGFHFTNWTLDGAFYSKANPLTVTDAQRDMVLVAGFSNLYTLTFATDGTPGAYVQGATYQTLLPGADATKVTAVDPSDDHFLKWNRDGAYYSTDRMIDVLNVQADMSFVAVYSGSVYTVTFGTGSVPGTTLTGTTPQFILLGEDCTPVRVNPPHGYRFAKWLSNGVDYSWVNPVTVTGVTGGMVLTPVLVPDSNVWMVK